MKVCSFRKLTLSAAAALVAISLSPGPAQATCASGTPAGTCRVTVRGLQYDVTTFQAPTLYDTITIEYTVSNNVSKFAPPPAPGAMPWWGDSVLAGEFAAAVGNGLNVKPPGKVELTPAFPYQHVERPVRCSPRLPGDARGSLLTVKYSALTGQVSQGGAMGWPPKNFKCGYDPQATASFAESEKSIFWPQATLVPIP